MSRRRLARGVRLTAALLTAACGTPQDPTAPPPTPGPGGALAAVTCRVEVTARVVTCGGGDPRFPHDVFGGAGVYLDLITTAPQYDPQSGSFTFAVAIRNLSDQPFGTPNGVTATGVRLFVDQGPTVTGGTGSVALSNADAGDGIFTGTGQSYFNYPGILWPDSTSAPRTWVFAVSPGVTRFEYQAFVDADLPQPGGPLRWTVDTIETSVRIATVGGLSADGDSVLVAGATLLPGFSTGSLWSVDGQQWWNAALTGGEPLRAVWGYGTGQPVAVGGAGYAARRTPAGWVYDTLPARQDLWGVWGSVPTDVFTVGSRGTIGHWDGTGWTMQPSGTGAYLFGVAGHGPADVMAVGGDSGGGIILRYTGAQWAALATGPEIYYGVAATSPNTYVVVGTHGAILRYSGGTATPMPSPTTNHLYAVWGSSDTDIYAVGALGTLLHYDGAAWTTVATGMTEDLTAVSGTAGGPVYVSSLRGTVLRDDAGVWSRMAGRTPSYDGTRVTAIWGTTPAFVLAVASDGSYARFDGVTWRRFATGSPSSLTDLSGTSRTDAVAVGENGTILRWDGSRWKPETSPVSSVLTAVAAVSDSEYVAVALDGAILRSRGSTWSLDRPASGEILSDVAAVPGTREAFAVGHAGVILRYDGAQWMTLASPLAVDFQAVHALSPTEVWAIGARRDTTVTLGVVLHFDGVGWQVRSTATAGPGSECCLFDVWGAGGNSLYLSGSSGLYWYNGADWVLLDRPARLRGRYGTLVQRMWGTGGTAPSLFGVGNGREVLHGLR